MSTLSRILFRPDQQRYPICPWYIICQMPRQGQISKFHFVSEPRPQLLIKARFLRRPRDRHHDPSSPELTSAAEQIRRDLLAGFDQALHGT
ncbi:MAG: hypothetical protein WB768_03870, partial [Bradyrhizobium sp.]